MPRPPGLPIDAAVIVILVNMAFFNAQITSLTSWFHQGVLFSLLAANQSRFWLQHSAAEEMIADLNKDHSISMSSETSGISRNFADMLDANCFLFYLSRSPV